jgi:ankyrin repeat protein
MNKSKKKLLKKKHNKTYKKKLLKQKIKTITKHKNKKQLHKKTKTKTKNRIKGGTKEDDMLKLFADLMYYMKENNFDDMDQKLKSNPDIINYQVGEKNTSLLQQAIIYDKPDIVKVLLDNGADINLLDNINMPPLNTAINEKNTEIANILIERGANVNYKNIYGITPQHLAAKTKNNSVLKNLLSKKEIEIDPMDNTGASPLIYASIIGDIECMKILLDNGANINVIDINGRTPIFYALESGQIDALKLLIDKGADLNKKDKKGNTLLDFATINRNFEVIKLLLENGIDINYKNTNGESLLITATLLNSDENNVSDLFHLLFNKGARKYIDEFDNQQITPLMYAIGSQNIDLIELLLQNGADIKNVKTYNGKTALDIAEGLEKNDINKTIYKLFIDTDKSRYKLIKAVAMGNLDEAQTFINEGIPINIKNNNGDNLLQTACFKTINLDMVKLLLKNGVGEFINNQNKMGATALMYAVYQNNLPLVKLLLENGAMEGINDQDLNGLTALMTAVLQDDLEIVTLLLEQGADISLRDKFGNTALKLSKDSTEINTLLKAKAREIIQKKMVVSNQNNNQKQPEDKQEKQEVLQNLLSNVNADLLIKEEEKLEAKKLAQKNKKLLSKQRKNEEKIQKEVLENQLKRENEENERKAREIKEKIEEENFQKEQQLYLQELKKQEEIERIFQEKVTQEERENAELEEKLIKEAVDKSIETFNNEKLHAIEKDIIEKEAFSFGEKYFGGVENIKIIKTEIENMELLKDNNAFEKLKEILPAYSNNFISKDPVTNNIISLLYILIGILSNTLKDMGIYLMLKGGSAIQNVGSQVPTQFMVPYESNDIDIVLINTNNLNNPNDNEILAEQIANFLIWVTEENNNLILTQTPNIDKTHPIVKIILNKNKKPLVDIDYNILLDNIYNLYMIDIYSKPFFLGQTSGLFYSPSIKSLIYERIYYLIKYSTKEEVKNFKSKSFFEKIPKSLNYLVKVLFIKENDRESNKDELKTFYEELFTETFNFFGITKVNFNQTHGRTIDELIQMCIVPLPPTRTTFYNVKDK